MVPAHAGVVPGESPRRGRLQRGPRARGGGPRTRAPEEPTRWWSPRTRGWSRDRVHPGGQAPVVPAHAGVVPPPPRPGPRGPCGPRARGGGPAMSAPDLGQDLWSPRTRGWSHVAGGLLAGGAVVPAHAGVVLNGPGSLTGSLCGPRARGGGPAPGSPSPPDHQWSPRTRGWSHLDDHDAPERGVVPAHAGVVPERPRPSRRARGGPRARGGGPAARPAAGPGPWWSPRTRGWSHGEQRQPQLGEVVPAHAGVVPCAPPAGPPSRSGPRARGGGPGSGLLARHLVGWSPRTRGWSHLLAAVCQRRAVVPAHAGVVPGSGTRPAGCRSGPRARGGGPQPPGTSRAAGRWSPRTRGWSREPLETRTTGGVVPAHAGVVPRSGGRCTPGLGGPRARGGGPLLEVDDHQGVRWSPRTRGWSPHR